MKKKAFIFRCPQIRLTTLVNTTVTDIIVHLEQNNFDYNSINVIFIYKF